MSISLGALYAKAIPLPKEKSAEHLKNQQKIEEVTKVFFPHLSEHGVADSKAFNKDFDRMNQILCYGGQTIYQKFQNQFDLIDQLEAEHQNILKAQKEERAKEMPDQTVLDRFQQKYDEIQDRIDEVTLNLKAQAKGDFEGFLMGKLGPSRWHLIPEIQWRFSQKALTSFLQEVDKDTLQKKHGYFTDSKLENRCELIIPENPNRPIEITVSSKGIFQSFQPGNGREKKVRQAKFIGKAVYTIPTNGTTKGTAQFSLKEPNRSWSFSNWMRGLM